MGDFSTRTGALSKDAPIRAGGKVIAEWSFSSPFRHMGKEAAPSLPNKLVVKVSLQSTKDGLTFCAHSEHLKTPVWDTDINRLHTQVQALMQTQHDLLAGITWEDWIEVKVENATGGSWKGARSNGLVVTCSDLKRGVNPVDGVAYTINSNNLAVPFPMPKKAGELDEGSEETAFGALGGRERHVECSYLPATPENIAGLDEIMARIDTLRAKLSEFLREDAIQDSLANLRDGLPALPFSTSNTDRNP